MAEAPVVEIFEVPQPNDRIALLRLLGAFETEKAGPLDYKTLALLLRDEGGATVGGLYGWTMFRWLIVESLFVPEHLRGTGLGTDLMARAEAVARQRGAIGIWLDTYSFQAREFYEKLGFSVFGQVDDHPPGEARYFMSKRF